jgi:hypothetical protein
MSAALKTAKTPTPPTAPERVAPEPVAPAPPGFRTDTWALWFWLACAGVLLLLHVSNALGALLRAWFGP